MIVDLAEHDLALFRKLDMVAATVDADDRTLEKRLGRAIDDATRTGGFIEYREAAGWAADVDSVLDSISDLASGPRAAAALGLAERAIDRIERAVKNRTIRWPLRRLVAPRSRHSPDRGLRGAA